MIDLRQLIIDGATAYNEETLADGEPPVKWTAADLAEAATEYKWNNGIPLTCDMEEIAGTLNNRFKDRQPVKPAAPVSHPQDEEVGSDDDTASNGTPLLLPIIGMEGYSVDPFGRPHADKRQGRKGGVITLDKFFRKDRTFICGYRVRIGEKRKRFTPRYFIMARYFAEQKWRNGEN